MGPGLWKSREDTGVRSEWGPAQPRWYRVTGRRAEDGLWRGRGRAGRPGWKPPHSAGEPAGPGGQEGSGRF